MKTINVINSRSLSVVRYVEIGLYVILAAWLISRIFEPAASFTSGDSLIVLAGAILGLMAICGATPLTAMLGQWTTRHSQPVLSKVLGNTARVLPFGRRNHRDDQTTSDRDETPRRAA